MPRRIEDIIPNNDRRSIRDIPVAKRSTEKPKNAAAERPAEKKVEKSEKKAEVNIPVHIESPKTEPVSPNRMSLTPPPIRKKRSGGGMKWLLIVLGIIVIIAGLGYIASVYFARAKFTIVPRTIPVQINSTYAARSSSATGVTSTTTLVYEIMTLKGSASSTVPASNGSLISTKAAGSITLYNASGNAAQRLVAGTRLTTDSGKVYRLTSSVVIPAPQYSSTKSSIVPGSISASIVADQPGEEYNISSSGSISDFKVAAFKATAKYETVYGRIKSEITGGFVGTKKIVNPTVLASTTAVLQSQLTGSLLNQAQAAVPEGYLMYDGGYTSSFTQPTISYSDTTSARVAIQGTINALIFKKSDLVSRLAGNGTVSSFGSFGYDAPGLEDLSFKIVGIKSATSTLTAKIQGSIQLIARVPVEDIQKKVAGASLPDIQTILKQFDPVIQSVSAEIMPPWSKIPLDLSRISVVVQK